MKTQQVAQRAQLQPQRGRFARAVGFGRMVRCRLGGSPDCGLRWRRAPSGCQEGQGRVGLRCPAPMHLCLRQQLQRLVGTAVAQVGEQGLGHRCEQRHMATDQRTAGSTGVLLISSSRSAHQ